MRGAGRAAACAACCARSRCACMRRAFMQVLLDGNFIHTTMAARQVLRRPGPQQLRCTPAAAPALTARRPPPPHRSMPDLSEHIPKLLGARCKLYVTRCVTRELEELGAEFAQVRACTGAQRACACARSMHVQDRTRACACNTTWQQLPFRRHACPPHTRSLWHWHAGTSCTSAATRRGSAQRGSASRSR